MWSIKEIGQSYRMSGDITYTFGDTGKDCAVSIHLQPSTQKTLLMDGRAVQDGLLPQHGYAGCSVLTIIQKMREISAF